MPFVMQNKKFFPSDFFASSPNGSQSRSIKQETRSAARKETSSLNRNNNRVLDYQENKNEELNLFRVNTNCVYNKCRSVSKGSKLRPRSYRATKRNYLQQADAASYSSAVSNISIVQPANIDDSFTSF